MQSKVDIRRSTRLTIALLAVLSLVPLIIAFRYPAFLGDDALITLTYSKNLAAGNGFVFNHPPAVLGTTTPLMATVIAGVAVGLRPVEIPTIAVFFTALCWIGIMWIFFFFRKEWELSNWQVCILALVLMSFGWIGFLGMEAYLFAFLLILTISLFLGRRYWLAGFVCALLFLTRGEGVLVLAVLLIAATVQCWTTRRSIDVELARTIARLVIGFAVPVLLWAIFAQLTFGSVLPNSLSAKQGQAQLESGRPFFQELSERWLPTWGRAFIPVRLPSLNFWWLIIVIGFVDALLRKRIWLIPLGWIALYILGYSLLNVSAYWWYQLPILFVLNLFFALGIITIVELLTRHVRQRRLALALSILVVAVLVFVPSRSTYNAVSNYRGDGRGESYTNLSRWLRANTEPSDSVAFIEVGYLGYYTDNRIIDLAGLVLSDLTGHIVEGDYAWGFWHNEPDYYVYLPDFDWALGSIRADPRFDQQYQPVTTLPGPRETDFTIYERIQ